ncbi:hypothetical protein Lal_00039278 [Lupinus albus]|nr:hypothetical protein Lal_00039278 [Lupinus albus]
MSNKNGSSITTLRDRRQNPFLELIRVFYYNLKLENETLYSYVKGKHIALTLTEFGECLSLPSTGVMLGSFIECPWSGFNKREFYFSLCRFSEAEISRKRSRSAAGSSRETLGVGNLTVENRLLHYFMEYVIFHKGSNYSQVNDFELQLLYGILNMESINWSFVIFQLMINQTTKSGPLPYAFEITRILQKFNVDFTIELDTPFSIKEHRIDLTSLGKMQIVEAPDDDAPLEAPAQPAPPAPQDLGNSPDYQSIMDELASHRAELVNMHTYMTTRMDHIDSRLNSMDSRFDEITSLLRNLQSLCHHQKGGDCEDGDLSQPMAKEIKGYKSAPKNFILYQPSDPCLSERFSLERERFIWEGEILGYIRGFSPERELSRLGEKCHFGAVATMRFSLERESLA